MTSRRSSDAFCLLQIGLQPQSDHSGRRNGLSSAAEARAHPQSAALVPSRDHSRASTSSCQVRSYGEGQNSTAGSQVFFYLSICSPTFEPICSPLPATGSQKKERNTCPSLAAHDMKVVSCFSKFGSEPKARASGSKPIGIQLAARKTCRKEWRGRKKTPSLARGLYIPHAPSSVQALIAHLLNWWDGDTQVLSTHPD